MRLSSPAVPPRVPLLRSPTGALVADVSDRRLGAFPGRWRLLLGASAAPPLAQLLCLLPMPESPRWLATRGAARYAQVVLGKLRSPAEASAEAPELLASAEAAVESEEGRQMGPRALLAAARAAPHVGRALIACAALQALPQLANATAVASLRTPVLEMAGFQMHPAFEAALLPSVLNLIGAALGCILVDRVGRRCAAAPPRHGNCF